MFVIDTNVDGFGRWVGAEIRGQIRTTSPRMLTTTTRRPPLWDLDVREDPDLGMTLVSLPIDGPVSAVGLAARALLQRVGDAASRTVVLATAPEGPPPAPDVVHHIAFAGLLPGVDLQGFPFASTNVLWVTATDRLIGLRRPVHLPEVQQETANLVIGLGLVTHDVSDLCSLHEIAAGRTLAPLHIWHEILRGAYVSAVFNAVRRGQEQLRAATEGPRSA